MKKFYIDITIGNDIGEMLEKRFYFDSMDELRNFDLNSAVNEAEKVGEEEGWIIPEEYDETPEYDGSSREDLINSDEKFQ